MLPDTFTPQLLRQLEVLRIRSRRAFLGSREGGHLSLKRGHGLEFSDHRKYEMGDHPRSIDWGVYARSDRLYVKRFQEEQDLSVLIMVDTSASMGTPVEERKWECARDLAIALSYIALMQQDTVHIAALGRFVSPRLIGVRTIHHIGEMLSMAVPAGQLDPVRQVALAASRIKFPGVAVFISDFLFEQDEIERAFNVLRAKNLDITALQVLAPSDLRPFAAQRSMLAVDSETGTEMALTADADVEKQYDRIFARHSERLREYLAKAQIAYVRSVSDMSLSAMIADEMTFGGLLQ